MTVQYSEEILNKYLAPNIYSFDQADIPDLRDAHDQSVHWMGNHFLNAVFRGTFEPPSRQFVINVLYRAQTTFDFYHRGRELTLEHLERSTPGSPSAGLYFQALASWEVCFQNLAILVDLLNKWRDDPSHPVFPGKDGSAIQRAFDINNAIKHFSSNLNGDDVTVDLTVPMWLESDGFHTYLLELKYEELAEIVGDAATLADGLQDPTSHFAIPRSDES